MVEHLLIVQWVVGSFPHGGPIKLFLIPAWCNKGCTCFPVCVHIKVSLLEIGGSGCNGFPLSYYLNYPLPYVQCHITINKMY